MIVTPTKLSTTVRKIDALSNKENLKLIKKFHEFMISNGSSDRHQNNNLKAIISFANFLGATVTFSNIITDKEILSFLDSKIKTNQEDPDKKWITTWNDYMHRIKHFLRWLHNRYSENEHLSIEDWKTPKYLQIKEKRTKRISPYLETELWEKEDLLTIIKYEPYRRNKAIISLLWDLNARPHEITLMAIKHIRLKEKYGEGEIPHQAKTGTGPLLLTFSFPYVRDWLNEHPFRNEPNARLICNLNNGSRLSPDNIDKVMKQLRGRIIRLLNNGEVTNHDEQERLWSLIKTKKWNPYCIRHSAITADSDYLPEYALKKKVRWSMNSRQGNRYIKSRMGNDLKQKILTYNGIAPQNEMKRKPSVLDCPRCELINAVDNKYCSTCSYPLVPSAFDELKVLENRKFEKLENKYEKMNSTLQAIFSIIQDIDQQGKREFAVSLIKSGLYSEAKA
jgi:integrase/recombinase XerD